MKKRAIVLSRPEKLVSVSVSAISRPLNKKQREEIKRLVAMPDLDIDFSDTPDTGQAIYKPVKRPIAMRIDSDILAWLRSKPGYQTRINQILRDAMTAARK